VQLAVQQIQSVCSSISTSFEKRERAVDGQAAQRRRADIEDNVHVLVMLTASPSPGTWPLGQVAGSDQSASWAKAVV
jgi:hypothetical protein